eukprot:GHUV01030454.1.p1 GENE.GHUV01030454.1~~GHUV01030454.1.p1  ORF type:complete len:132 (-),score=13.66 GHUV01030454.1:733-1128(-)
MKHVSSCSLPLTPQIAPGKSAELLLSRELPGSGPLNRCTVLDALNIVVASHHFHTSSLPGAICGGWRLPPSVAISSRLPRRVLTWIGSGLAWLSCRVLLTGGLYDSVQASEAAAVVARLKKPDPAVSLPIY